MAEVTIDNAVSILSAVRYDLNDFHPGLKVKVYISDEGYVIAEPLEPVSGSHRAVGLCHGNDRTIRGRRRYIRTDRMTSGQWFAVGEKGPYRNLRWYIDIAVDIVSTIANLEGDGWVNP